MVEVEVEVILTASLVSLASHSGIQRTCSGNFLVKGTGFYSISLKTHQMTSVGPRGTPVGAGAMAQAASSLPSVDFHLSEEGFFF